MFLNDLPYLCIKSSKAMRIELTKQEKLIMKRLQQGVIDKPDDMSGTMFQWSVTNLSRHGFLLVAYSSGGVIVSYELTFKGEAYLESNPQLYNPINWDKWFAISCIISSALLAIIIYLRLTI